MKHIFEHHDFHHLTQHVHKDALVVLDIDNTVMRGTSIISSAQWFYYTEDKLIAERGLTRQEALNLLYPLYMAVEQITEAEPVHDDISDLTQSWQKEGIGVIGLTARQPRVADATLRKLNSIEVEFGPQKLRELLIQFEAPHPAMMREGVIFASEFNNKGEIFEQYLQQISEEDDIFPERIIFVDDLQHNVDAVGHVVGERALEYVGMRCSNEDQRVKVFDVEQANAEFERVLQTMPKELLSEIQHLVDALR